jgi:hypothetical protein
MEPLGIISISTGRPETVSPFNQPSANVSQLTELFPSNLTKEIL